MAPLPRKTSCDAQVALQHCPILHMSKRKSMIPTEFHTVNWLNLLRKPGSKPSGQVAQFAPDLRLRRTGISNWGTEIAGIVQRFLRFWPLRAIGKSRRILDFI